MMMEGTVSAGRSPQILASAEAGPSSARLSPIIARDTHVPTPSQPEFAELLTPAKLRRKRRHEPQVNIPAGLPAFRAGISDGGYYTPEGDFFRGATSDPSVMAGPFMPQLEEDALTIGGSSSSSSSSGWSWTSDLERGRRATMAVFERVGEALGVRRGSTSSGSSDSSSTHELKSQASGVPRKRRLSRLSRTISRGGGNESAQPDKPRREYLPRKRQFVLLVPPEDEEGPRRVGSSDHLDSDSTVNRSLPQSERVISTPSLPDVLDRIRRLRMASGIAPEPAQHPGLLPDVRRTHSGSGRRRPRARGLQSFAPPPVPQRPVPSRAQTRVQELKGAAFAEAPIRPKSASDLLGMATSASSSASAVDLPLAASSDSLKSLPAETPPILEQKGCWWLDVSCPTWEDLRDIGELLALHPLTLEDVLQQDPREKLDLFERLGYYFVAIRALDEGYFKYTPGTGPAGPTVSGVNSPPKTSPTGTPSMPPAYSRQDPEKKEGRRRGWGMGRAVGRSAQNRGEKVEIVEDNPGREGLEGVGVGGVNVYLVVFADGIVSFHYEDISKHTKRVLDRILSQAGGDHTSDWVAHGLLDSIVDAFFPLIRYVDGEVDDIDSLTIDPTHDPKADRPPSLAPSVGSDERLSLTASDESFGLSGDGAEYIPLNYLEEKRSREMERTKAAVLPRYALFPRLDLPGRMTRLTRLFTLPPDKRVNMHMNLPRPFAYPFVYLGLFFLPITDAVKPKHHSVTELVVDRSVMLRRITDTRRLVSGLTRLLGAKHQVIARMRKRIADKNRNVEAYIGDVEDHILLLQNSLYHYEYILSHCQPAFLSHLSVSFAFARGGTDKAILALSTVSISILPMMLVIGMFSMNVSIPHNGASLDKPHAEADGSVSPFNWFIGVVAAAFVIACIMVAVIRYWRWTARRKWAHIRGEPTPPFWRGYWGWE